jgi:hypothetical protein
MNQIVLQQVQPQIIIEQTSDQIVVQQTMPQIIVQGGSIVANIIPFTFTASATGQTTFGPLPTQPTVVICLFITGAGQNQLGGDFIINNSNYIVLSDGVNKGDTVYGAYEV